VVLSGYSGFSTTKAGRHDIAEILLKVALNTKNQINQIKPESRSRNIKKLEFIFFNLIATFQRYCFSGARYIYVVAK